MIEFNMSKNYGDFPAVKSLKLKIKKGEIFGLLGPNGAGKSTTMRVLVGLLTPTEGYVEINGETVSEKNQKLKRKVGFLPEETALYKSLTVLEYLTLFQELYGVKDERKNFLLSELGIDDIKEKRCGELSKGLKKRVSIARTLLHDPEIIVLDEPTGGLDPVSTRKIREIILSEHKKGKTIIVSSHILSEIEKIATRIGILVNGKLVTTGTLDSMKADFLKDHKKVFKVIIPKSSKKKAGKSLKSPKKEGDYLSYEFEGSFKKLLSQLKNVEVVSIKRKEPDLEDIFFEEIENDGSTGKKV